MISVIVITKNEEERIKVCLESVKWADEIIVADNGSTDGTIKIAREYTNKIISFADTDFSTLRNKAFEEAKGDWVLYVDSDERVLKSLKDEIKNITEQGEYSAVAISRRNIIFGEEVNYGPFWPDWVIRLFKREDFQKYLGKIHEQPKFEGKLGYTKHSLLHLTHRDIDHIVLKSLDWSNVDAQIRKDANHPQITGWRLIRILITELWNQGIMRRGFFSGTVGVADSLLQTFSLVIAYIRLWQLQQSKSRDEVYKELDQKLLKNDFSS